MAIRGRKLEKLKLTEIDNLELKKMTCDETLSKRVRIRANIILKCASGKTNLQVAESLSVSDVSVGKWRGRFLLNGLKGLKDDRRCGRPAKISGRTASLSLSRDQQQELERFARRSKTSQSLALRSRIVLECSKGKNNVEVASLLGISSATVGKWRRRFIELGVDGLLDEQRCGSPRKISDNEVEQVVVKTLEETPRDATHWSTRSMAKATGIKRDSIHRIWKAFGLKPHLTKTFKLSKDPQFIEKVRDIVGLYLNPPEKALVLCVDEKSQIQALNRTQPLLPMSLGHKECRTHDYERHGTTSLFAALNTATGEVLGKCYRNHRSVEFKKFLDYIDERVPQDQEIHLILDNYGTHKTEMINKWLSKRERYHLHFTPTSSSWLNQVERWFGLLTEKQIRRGTFTSVKQLEEAIKEYLEIYNEDPKPFVWTKSADVILDKIKRTFE